MSLLRGGGDLNRCPQLPVIADSSLVTILDAFVVAGTKIVGKLLQWSFTQNYGVVAPGSGGQVNGRIISAKKTNGVWNISAEMWSYTDHNSTTRALTEIINVAYSGTFNLQDTIAGYSTTATSVQDGGTGGFGACIAKDTPAANYADIMI